MNVLKRILLVISFAIPMTASAAPVLNPANGHYYEVVSTMSSWPDANLAAQAATHLSVPGHLVTITSSAEQAWFTAFLVTESPDEHVHIGGVQDPGGSEPGGGWSWVTGETMTYTSWYPGEPNEYLGNSEDSMFAFRGNSADAGLWADGQSPQARWFVIEYDVAPVANELTAWSLVKTLFR